MDEFKNIQRKTPQLRGVFEGYILDAKIQSFYLC